MRKMLCLLVAAFMLIGVAFADEVEWTFGVPIAEIDDSLLVLASSSDPLLESYQPQTLETVRTRHNNENGEADNNGIYTASNAKIQLRKDVLNALRNMFSAAESEGVILYIRGGYRSWADQTRRYNQAVKSGDTGVPKPGETDYQTGLAVMVVNKAGRGGELSAAAFSQSAEGVWLQRNAARYGFIVRYPIDGEASTGCAAEPWHLRYVGEGVASYIAAHNMTLEDFLTRRAEAYDDYVARGGDLQQALLSNAKPKGAYEVTDETGPDGDFDVVLFHD